MSKPERVWTPAEERAIAELARWKRDPVAFVREMFGCRPDPWQEDALGLAASEPRVGLSASKGPGKLHPKSMHTPTPTGWRAWGDLQVGDQVFAEDGTPTTIVARHENGEVPVVRVVFDDGSSVRCGLEHLWRVRGATERRHGTWSVLTTQQILDRGVRVKNGRWAGRQFEVPHQGAAQFPAQDLPLDPYLLGVWIGDGTADSGRYTKPYPEVEDEIQARGYETSRHPDGQVVSVRGLWEGLKELSLAGLKSPERFIPPAYMVASVQQRSDLLCGLMDTDGCIGSDGHMEYATTSERLAGEVVELVRSLGGVALVKAAIKHGWYTNDDGERVECRDCYRVTVTLPWNPFRISHKSERWHEPQARYLTRYIDRIEPAGAEDSMCIEVAHPSGCYLASDYVVTHNSALLAWVGWWNLYLWVDAQGIATSITSDNLRDNLWKELAFWYSKAPALQQTFAVRGERIENKARPRTWWLSARSFARDADPQAQANTLAGLHAQRVFALLDEMGEYPLGVLDAAEGLFATAGQEAHVIAAWNCTSTQGAAYEVCTRRRNRWSIVSISGDPDDPKRSPRVDIEWARQVKADWGEDSPIYLVNVAGKFPLQGADKLLGPDDVVKAEKRDAPPEDYRQAPIIFGLDCARFGLDKSVLYKRQGPILFRPWRFSHCDGVDLANKVSHVIHTDMQDEERNPDGRAPDYVFVDVTGIGASPYDQLRALGWNWIIPVDFGGSADDDRYADKRAEMYSRAAKWIQTQGCLPAGSGELGSQMCEPSIKWSQRGKRTCFVLESKEQMRARGVPSPDTADAFALTFYAESPVRRDPGRQLPATLGPASKCRTEYDRYAQKERRS